MSKKIHLQYYYEKKFLSTSNPSILVVPFKSLSNNQNKPYIKVAFNECSFCK